MTGSGDLWARHRGMVAQGRQLDLTRGKPSAAQLDLSNALLTQPGAKFRDAASTDLRNYGGPLGLPELRSMFGELLAVPAGNLLAGGNSRLALRHDALVAVLLQGVAGSRAGTSRHRGRARTSSLSAPSPGTTATSPCSPTTASR